MSKEAAASTETGTVEKITNPSAIRLPPRPSPTAQALAQDETLSSPLREPFSQPESA